MVLYNKLTCISDTIYIEAILEKVTILGNAKDSNISSINDGRNQRIRDIGFFENQNLNYNSLFFICIAQHIHILYKSYINTFKIFKILNVTFNR